MSEKVYEALGRHFAKHRIVFWYDPQGMMRDVFAGYKQGDIQKIELENNEFMVRHALLRGDGDAKYLVYSPKERPPEASDWLLDLALGNFVFSTDEASMYIQDLGLSESLRRVVQDRLVFFRDARERFDPLATLAKP
ncbi:MAG: hypothetical protein ACOYM2_18375, partial [Rectinemataceae bacterium]